MNHKKDQAKSSSENSPKLSQDGSIRKLLRKTFPLKLSSGKPSLHLTPEAYMQISYLCAKVPKTEWSGYCFYTEEGDIVNDPDNYIATVHYVALMSIDTAGHTDFSASAKLLDAYEFNEALEEMKRGFIHSHHGMNAYFSGEDESELKENSENYNFYLSLIVNNYQNFVARMCHDVITSSVITNIKWKDSSGKWLSVPQKEQASITSTEVHYWDFTIKYPAILQQAKHFLDLANKENEEAAKAAKRASASFIKPNSSYSDGQISFPFNYGEEVKYQPTSLHNPTVWSAEEKITPEEEFLAELVSNDPELIRDVPGLEDIFADVEEYLKEDKANKTTETLEDIQADAEDIIEKHRKNFDNALTMKYVSLSLLKMYKDKYPLTVKAVENVIRKSL